MALAPATIRRTWLERLLNLAVEVRPGEAATALLLTANGFLILTAYYVIRPVRSALLLPVEIALPGGGILRGPEITSYSGAMLAALFLFIVPLYGAIASRVNRIRLINGVTLFFISNLVGFFLLGAAEAPAAVLGVSFFLWIGVFNLMVIAQFWSFANDLYTPEEGKRLFALVGFGGTVGAIAGAFVASRLIVDVGELAMMLIAAGILVVCLLLTNLVHARERDRVRGSRQVAVSESLARGGGFRLVLGNRYLLLIGLLTLAVQLVNTNGNYIFNATLTDMARASVAAGTSSGLTERQVVGSYQAGMDFWQNVLVVLIQFFLVSRVFKYAGVGGALFVLPVLALGSYSLFAAAPILAFIRIAKIAENATDYSLQNTVRRALFLPTSREAKYKALNAIETFFWRAGDMLSGLATLVVVRFLGLGVRPYALVNLAVVIVWLAIAVLLAREHGQIVGDADATA